VASETYLEVRLAWPRMQVFHLISDMTLDRGEVL
jgi:hypothetical protein